MEHIFILNSASDNSDIFIHPSSNTKVQLIELIRGIIGADIALVCLCVFLYRTIYSMPLTHLRVLY